MYVLNLLIRTGCHTSAWTFRVSAGGTKCYRKTKGNQVKQENKKGRLSSTAGDQKKNAKKILLGSCLCLVGTNLAQVVKTNLVFVFSMFPSLISQSQCVAEMLNMFKCKLLPHWIKAAAKLHHNTRMKNTSAERWRTCRYCPPTVAFSFTSKLRFCKGGMAIKGYCFQSKPPFIYFNSSTQENNMRMWRRQTKPHNCQ